MTHEHVTPPTGPPASPHRSPGRISRRTVVSGTAWAVPAVVVATAAPALAASPTSCTYTSVSSTGGVNPTCRAIGSTRGTYLGYRVKLNIYRDLNCSRDALTLTVTVSSPGVIPASTQVSFLPNQNSVTVTGLNLTTGDQLQSVTVTYSINGTQAGPPTIVSLAGLTNVC